MKLKCIIIEPNSKCHDYIFERSATGKDCLKKICEELSIFETDYFGLQYYSPSGTLKWLHTRNRLRLQLRGKIPYHLFFRVKYFVHPDALLQLETRRLFFDDILDDLQTGRRLRFQPEDNISKATYLSGLLRQINYGNYPEQGTIRYPQYFSGVTDVAAALEHRRNKGLSKDMAIYNFLHEVSSWELYQTNVFDGLEQVQENGHFRRVSIGISKNEFLIFDHRGLMIQKISQGAIRQTSYTAYYFRIKYRPSLKEKELQTMEFSSFHHESLHREIHRRFWEIQEFYRNSDEESLPDLRKKVYYSFAGDLLKGMGLVRFAKRYRSFVFDVDTNRDKAIQSARCRLDAQLVSQVMTTAQHSYDNATTFARPMPTSSAVNLLLAKIEKTLEKIDGVELDAAEARKKRELEELMCSIRCNACLENARSIRFACGHVYACTRCSALMQSCPVCRQRGDRLHLFLPIIV